MTKLAGSGPTITEMYTQFIGTVYFTVSIGALLNLIAFIVTGRHCFLYTVVALAISLGAYMGFFRGQIEKKFNIVIYTKIFWATKDNSTTPVLIQQFPSTFRLKNKSVELEAAKYLHKLIQYFKD